MILLILGAAFLGQVEPPHLAPKIEEGVRASVVSIQNKSRPGQANGVVVDQAANVIYVLTCAHFIEADDKLWVTVFPGGTDAPRPRLITEVSIVDRLDKNVQDLAILRLAPANAPRLDVMPVAAPEAIPTRKPFTAFSLAVAPLFGAQVRVEEVLGVESLRKGKASQSAEFWKVKNLPEKGRSGGPLVDVEGRLIGICSGEDGKAGYYTHLREIRKFLDDKVIFYTTEPKSKKEDK